MPIVNDIDRPDRHGNPPKMAEICKQVCKELEGITPYLSIYASDNLMSSVTIRGTFEPKEEWTNGIFHNARYFIISLVPMKGKRYYTPGEDITVDVTSLGHQLPKLRKYTGPVDKCIAKVKAWIEDQKT